MPISGWCPRTGGYWHLPSCRGGIKSGGSSQVKTLATRHEGVSLEAQKHFYIKRWELIFRGQINWYALIPEGSWYSMANIASSLPQAHLSLTDSTPIFFRVAMSQHKGIKNYVLPFLQLGWHTWGKGDVSKSHLGISGKVLLSWNRCHHFFSCHFHHLPSWKEACIGDGAFLWWSRGNQEDKSHK